MLHPGSQGFMNRAVVVLHKIESDVTADNLIFRHPSFRTAALLSGRPFRRPIIYSDPFVVGTLVRDHAVDSQGAPIFSSPDSSKKAIFILAVDVQRRETDPRFSQYAVIEDMDFSDLKPNEVWNGVVLQAPILKTIGPSSPSPAAPSIIPPKLGATLALRVNSTSITSSQAKANATYLVKLCKEFKVVGGLSSLLKPMPVLLSDPQKGFKDSGSFTFHQLEILPSTEQCRAILATDDFFIAPSDGVGFSSRPEGEQRDPCLSSVIFF